MQNAWRFVADEALRERLKEAKGIGTPATRGEIIRGLKAQEFLVADGKNIVPTERGLALHGVLQRADPALVDPGVTAQMERLLDDVLVGRQEMMGAIDAVCDQASRIIGRLIEGAASGTAPALAFAGPRGPGEARPPTPAMKSFVESLARQKNLKPPAGYTKSGAACRAFLDQHAPSRTGGGAAPPRASEGNAPSRPAPAGGSEPGGDASPLHDASPPHDANPPRKRRTAKPAAGTKPGTKRVGKQDRASGTAAEKPVRRARSTTARAVQGTAPRAAQGTTPRAAAADTAPGTGTPLRIPYGNKEAAQSLGARYQSGAWYAPPGVSLAAFRDRGWL